MKSFIHFTRMYQWHPGKMPLMLGFVSVMLLTTHVPQQGFLLTLVAYVLTSLYLAASYMLNNIADKKIDCIVNKKIGLEGWSRGRLAIPVIIFAVLILGAGFALMPALAIYAIIGCYLLSWSYSFPPRFKEHVFFGPFVAAFAQIPAPALVMAVAWGTLPLPALIYLMVVFFYLLRMLLVHQILDYENDRITGTHTTAIRLGITTTKQLLRLIFALEALCLIVFLFLIVYTEFPNILLIALAWPLFLVILRLIRKEPIQLDSYSYIPFADVHESVVPLILVIGLAMCEGGLMIAIVPMVVILFLKRHIERLIIPLFGWKETADA